MRRLEILALPLLAMACTGVRAPRRATAPYGMARIPAGTWIAGTDSAELPALLARYHTDHADLFASEIPRHTVHVAGFFIDRAEVTKAAYREFLVANPHWRKDSLAARESNGHYLEDWTGLDFPSAEGMRPVAFITWPAASAYCAWRGGRLPNEMEWEWAARGGLADPEFPWGDDPADSSRANWSGARIGHPTAAGTFPPNGYSLFDMAGNLWEFTSDPWAVDTTQLSARARTEGPGFRYVIKGGSFEGAAVNLRIRYRDSHPSGGAGKHVGFRCARDA